MRQTSGGRWDPTRCRPIEKECNDHTLLDTANFGPLVHGYIFLRRPRICWLLCDCTNFLIPLFLDIFPSLVSMLYKRELRLQPA